MAGLIGCFLTTKHFAPIMIREGGGRILYVSSMICVQANPGQSAYGATKAGVTLLANVTHRELANRGIRTVALAPGLTDTPGIRASVDDDYIDASPQRTPEVNLGSLTTWLPSPCSSAVRQPATFPALLSRSGQSPVRNGASGGRRMSVRVAVFVTCLVDAVRPGAAQAADPAAMAALLAQQHPVPGEPGLPADRTQPLPARRG